MSIKVKNISYTYLPNTPNSYEALHDVSFEIPDNSFVGIVGHTGSGKSTLVQMFNGLLRPSSGTVDIDGFIVTNRRKIKNIKELRKHVGLVFQFPEYQLFEETVEKDVAFGLKNYGLPEEAALKKAREALKMLNVDESLFKRSPFDLSGGEKRKVAMAGILALDPDILVLDEPTAGLDPMSSIEVMKLLEKLHKNGKTIVVITHNMGILFRFCERTILMKDGRKIYDGDTASLFENGTSESLAIEIPKMFQFMQILRNKGVDVFSQNIKSMHELVDYLVERRDKHE